VKPIVIGRYPKTIEKFAVIVLSLCELPVNVHPAAILGQLQFEPSAAIRVNDA
jgi:hypothetical protein